ncbi:uncharacterized protein DUF2019 [Roseiarcus fermentans]|uniref:Uncharacterized protein DUF2019 n=1 Tax=Roseiarcus fermentans TaxID=1473586 RepID=A0A366FDZ5_9HYPH|nr:DUF2019 domain-containing protein [Roseiarcus fermentans]RBP12306.1 uncharacterized protein DUF2019 [Roseiarcus fermentans]
MKNFAKYTVPELLDQFRNACLAQYDTYLTDDVSKRNKLFDFLLAVTRELKSRGVEERRALLTLFADKNPQVRFQAASFVYAVAPVEAKACLEAIAAAGLPDQSLSAGMTLSGLEEDPNCLDWI